MNFLHPKPKKPHALLGPNRVITRTLQSGGSMRALMALLMISAFILLSQPSAWGSEFNLDAGPGGIKGFAQQVPLEKILSYLADQNGYVVQIDQALLNTPTTFYFPVAIPPERAIQRIVHPHSLALVFGRVPGKDEPVINQIKVFSKGRRSASYTVLSGNGASTVHDAYLRPGTVRSGVVGGAGVRAGREAVSKYVKPPVIITKSAMGFTGFKYKDSRRGPDYRPDNIAMAQAFANYRTEREGLLKRSGGDQLISAKQATEAKKNEYRKSRTVSLQKTINDSNN